MIDYKCAVRSVRAYALMIPRGMGLGAAFVLIFLGVIGARWSLLWGHAAIAGGALLVFFFAAAPQNEPLRDPSIPDTGRRWPIYLGLLMLLIATLLGAMKLNEEPCMFWIWCGGLLLTFSSSLVRVLRGLKIGKAGVKTLVMPCVFLCLLSSLVNFSFLADIPRAVHGDVGEIALTSRNMDPVTQTLEVSAWAVIPGLHNLIVKTGFLFSDGLFAARFSDALCGVLASLVLFLALRSWAGPPAAVATVILFICSANLMQTFRVGLALSPPILLSIAAVFFYWKAQVTSSRAFEYAVLTGIVCGVSLQVNLSARVIPLLIVLFTGHEALFRREWKRPSILLIITALVAALTAGPILAHYFHHSEHAYPRENLLIFGDKGFRFAAGVFNTESMAAVFISSLLRGVGMFHYFPDSAYDGFYVGETGFMEPVTALFFFLGLVTSLRFFKNSSFGWPLIGWFISILTLVSITINAPSYHRAGPAAAFAFILVGLGIDAITRPDKREAGTITASKEILKILSLGLLTAIGAVWGLRLYFFDYMDREFTNQNTITSIARRIAQEPRESTHVYMLGLPVFYYRHGTVRFLADGYEGVDILPGSRFPDVAMLPEGTNLFIAINPRASELKAFAARFGSVCLENHQPVKRSAAGYKVFTVKIWKDPSNRRKMTICGITK